MGINNRNYLNVFVKFLLCNISIDSNIVVLKGFSFYIIRNMFILICVNLHFNYLNVTERHKIKNYFHSFCLLKILAFDKETSNHAKDKSRKRI